MLRIESKRRARALQVLYALDTTGESDADSAATGLARLTGPEPGIFEEAQAIVDGVLAQRDTLDRYAQDAAENWRLDRVATIERNILRIGIHELLLGVLPPRIVIDEAIWLAHRFAGPRAPAFINGVLDRVARDLGRL
ncbi:MAG: transcription antitermination factor NusB [Gemmatimonadales bacterium]